MPRTVKPVSRVNGWRNGGNGHGWATAREESSSVLEALEDEYGGVVADAHRLPSGTGEFARSLAASLSYWKSAVRHHRPNVFFFSRVSDCHAEFHPCGCARCLWQ